MPKKKHVLCDAPYDEGACEINKMRCGGGEHAHTHTRRHTRSHLITTTGCDCGQQSSGAQKIGKKHGSIYTNQYVSGCVLILVACFQKVEELEHCFEKQTAGKGQILVIGFGVFGPDKLCLTGIKNAGATIGPYSKASHGEASGLLACGDGGWRHWKISVMVGDKQSHAVVDVNI
jgi:hypothetical protein